MSRRTLLGGIGGLGGLRAQLQQRQQRRYCNHGRHRHCGNRYSGDGHGDRNDDWHHYGDRHDDDPWPLRASFRRKPSARTRCSTTSRARPLTSADDITEGKTDLPLKLTLNIVNVNNGCAPILTPMVYVWHCDKDGYYSGYNQNGADLRSQTFLRGVQTTDTSGRAIFNTIYPGWYPGRATHIHFRVYLALDLQATSQLAFPDSVQRVSSRSTSRRVRTRRRRRETALLRRRDVLPTVTPNVTTGGDAELTVGITA